MSVFIYKARNKQGKIIEDTIESSSRKEAANSLRSEGLQILTIKESKQSQTILQRMQKVSVLEKAVFCRYLSTMMKAGLPLSEAVDILSEETGNKKMYRILIDLEYSIKRGQKLSSVFVRYPEVFDPVFITLTRAGEESGTLEQSFAYLSIQMMKNYELTQKVKGALLYPAVIISAMIGVGILMVTFVLPRISKVFLRLRIQLPVTTKALLSISQFLGDHYLLVILATIIILITSIILLQLSKTRKTIIGAASKIPVVARLFNQLDLARFSRTLSTLLKSGVPILESIKVSVNLLTQRKFTKLAKTFEEEIQKGNSLSDALNKGEGVFPSLMTQSVKAGEKSGSLEEVLTELADFYELEVEHSLKSLTSILEPVLMLIIGVAVGGMVISIIAPIYSVIGNLQQTTF
jgi:type IV pilus assembly protein PilC